MGMGSSVTHDRKDAGAEDFALVRGVLKREPEAIHRFTERMRCVARFLAVRNVRSGRLLSNHDLEDLTQEVLVCVWKRLDDFDGRGPLETWVFQFCYLQFLRHLRVEGRRLPGASLQDHLRAAESVQSPAELVAYDAYEPLYEALDALPEDEAGLLRLKHFEEMTFETIGARLGISPNTAKTRYYRALSRLGAALRRQSRASDERRPRGSRAEGSDVDLVR